jgi:hypothetical protein
LPAEPHKGNSALDLTEQVDASDARGVSQTLASVRRSPMNDSSSWREIS